ncbi:ABC transporter permease [Candidatus Pantoea multigeneris]|uniref:ABC transporter permease n=1 Tax=Candidatus Pantoea multigeneris TaxID=2608357 RepID=A0ABX0RCH9_9GAMM|nr:ABC transporter permease [Pantoea multigeneris]NIF23048.1 ABC transporter permease [Pantoea multigeneris]
MNHDPLLYEHSPALGRRRKFSLTGSLPLAFVALLLLVVLVPHWFTHYLPDDMDMDAILQPPSLHHLFGTDALGRDLYSRVVYGSALSLSIGLGATVLATAGGIVLGLLTSLGPRWLRQPLVHLLDILLAFPELLLALLIVAVLGRGPSNTLLAVGLSGIASYARLLRAQVLQVKLSGYVQQAVVLGERRTTIVLRHILPNALRPLLVVATLGVGQALLNASSLSFLGLGVVPPVAEWGALLADGRDFLDTAPWISLLPASVVALSVIALTLAGRRIQSRLTQGS